MGAEKSSFLFTLGWSLLLANPLSCLAEMGDNLPAVVFGDCSVEAIVERAQTCATGSKAVAIFAGKLHTCALLVSKRPPSV